jgi:hypothetical protein
MPLPSYTWGHPDAVLSDADRNTLCNWVSSFTASEGSRLKSEEGQEEVGEGKTKNE